MPTAAKLCGALCFALLGWVAVHLRLADLAVKEAGWLPEAAAGVGLVCGWVIAGTDIGRGMAAAAGTGIRTAVVQGVLVIAGLSVWTMLAEALARRLRDPGDALARVFDLGLGYGAMLGDGHWLAGVTVAAMLGGMLAEAAGRRWS